jgi:aminopeptidase S
MYYLPPYEVSFAVDGGPPNTTWRFDTLPGGADDKVYLDDFYVSPTCGDYHCREFYIDAGFIRDAQYAFPSTGGEHTVVVTVRDYAGNEESESFHYTVTAPPEGTAVWQDTFEDDLGWVRDPDGTDTAALGLWERGDPEPTDFSGPKQLGTAAFGANELVTGRLAGPNAYSHEVDGGRTSIRSPAIALPAGGGLVLSFYYTLAHGVNSSADDYLRVKVVGASTATVFEELGAAEDDDAAWALATVSLDAFAGQTVTLWVEAADGGPASLVEAAIDEVTIVSRGAE